MTGKELVLAAVKCRETERIPWVPFVGCHGGALLNITADKYLQSTDAIVAGVTKAVERYNPDGIPVAFDLQVEAEALGCELAWSEDNPPAVVTHPLTGDEKLSGLKIPGMDQGRIGLIMDAAAQLHRSHPQLALYGLATGPFTLALHLFGVELFLKMSDDDSFVMSLMDFCSNVCLRMADYYIDAGCDIIAIVDPMTSQISPEQFRRFVLPFASPVFDRIRQQEIPSSFFVCGQAQHNIEAMCDCQPDNISIDENIPLDYVRDICLERSISFGGNVKLTVVLLMGTQEDAQRNALDCMDIGGSRGFLLAPGCDLPYATPPENLECIYKLVTDPYQQQVIRTLAGTEKIEDVLDLRDYGQADSVMIDIITLDSESCAPCQYSVEAVKDAIAGFQGIAAWREHKIKRPESVTFMNSLMIKNIPTICIDGQIKFVSRIPPKDELIAAIQERIYEKLRFKIRMKKGSVLIFGQNEQECQQVLPLVEQAIHELGADVEIATITDKEETLTYGVTKTPAIVVARYKLKSEGDLPISTVVKEWIKEIL